MIANTSILSPNKTYRLYVRVSEAPAYVSVLFDGGVVVEQTYSQPGTYKIIDKFVPSSSNRLKITTDVFGVTAELKEVLRSPYKIEDGGEKMFVFSEIDKRWKCYIPERCELFEMIQNTVYSFKNGRIYSHTGPVNSFYGTQFRSMLSACFPGEGRGVKLFTNVVAEATAEPVYTHVRTEQPNVQSSDLSGEYRNMEGVYYAPILRDRLSPNTEGSFDQKMLFGDEMRGQYAKVACFFSPNTRLDFLNVETDNSEGHNL